MRIVQVERPWLRLNLSLRLTSEAVGINEAQLHSGVFALGQVADVGLTRNGGRAGWDAVEVIEYACRGGAEMIDGERTWIRRIKILCNLLGREVSGESVERIALDRPCRLALHCRADDHTERVEGGLT